MSSTVGVVLGPCFRSGRRGQRPPQKPLSEPFPCFCRSLSSLFWLSICFLLLIFPSLLSLLRVFCNNPLPPRGLFTNYSRRGQRPLSIRCSRRGSPGVTSLLLIYVIHRRYVIGGAIRCWTPGAHGSCLWSWLNLHWSWPLVWLWCISPWRRGYSNVVSVIYSWRRYWNLPCRFRGYLYQAVVGTRCRCPAFCGRQRVVTISGVSCVDRCVWRWLRLISRFSRVCFKINDCW